MEENQNLSVEKYLKAIAVMTNSVGKLDVLKLHLKRMYNDKMSITILESIIHDLSKTAGIDYKSMNAEEISTIKKEVEQSIFTVPKVEPLKVEITQNENENNINYSSDYGFAKYMNMTNETLNNKFNKNKAEQKKKAESKKPIKESKIEFDESTGNRTYQFVNSSTLAFMVYNQDNKELTMTFARNGRTYLYKNVPIGIFQNLVQIDENGQFSVGSYFQKNIAKQPKLYPYIELTDTEFVG